MRIRSICIRLTSLGVYCVIALPSISPFPEIRLYLFKVCASDAFFSTQTPYSQWLKCV